MPLDGFTEQVRSAAELASIVGTPSAGSLKKELQALDEHMRRFIAHSPFLVMSTHSADGRCDASPRGDAPGFVRVATTTGPERPEHPPPSLTRGHHVDRQPGRPGTDPA